MSLTNLTAIATVITPNVTQNVPGSVMILNALLFVILYVNPPDVILVVKNQETLYVM